MKKILVMCLAVCFMMVCISGAASAAVKAGDTIISGGLSYDATNLSGEGGEDLDISIFTTSVGVGKFFTDSFEAELGLIGQSMTVDYGSGSSTQQQLGLQVRPNWHFNTAGNTVPYIGLTLGYLWVEIEEENTGAFLYGGQAGIKQFVKENAYIQYEVGYTATTVEIFDEDIDVGDLRLSIGIGFKF